MAIGTVLMLWTFFRGIDTLIFRFFLERERTTNELKSLHRPYRRAAVPRFRFLLFCSPDKSWMDLASRICWLSCMASLRRITNWRCPSCCCTIYFPDLWVENNCQSVITCKVWADINKKCNCMQILFTATLLYS